MLKVAVASTDGTLVDEHFGRARVFRIYEVEEDGLSRLVEQREVAPLERSGGTAHGSDAAVERLADVNAVLAAQIGPHAQGALTRRGIRSFALGGPVVKALASYGKRHRLLDVKVPGLAAGYSPDRKCGGGCSPKGGCK